MSYLFFKHEGIYLGHGTPSLDSAYSFQLWKPKVFRMVPPGLKFFPYVVWGLMHFLRIFANQDYGIFMICRKDGYIAHRSIIMPRYFRFPFMGDADLQIGDVWTGEECRGKGLSSFALGQIVETCAKSGRKIWYVTDSKNAPSVRIAEKAGFILCGEGVRTQWMGISALGAYEIKKYETGLKS